MTAVLALAGGVGGAKLADGLQTVLAPPDGGGLLTVIVNTGDDFEHLGLHVCPDLDTVTYTLSGRANPETGWGMAGETWGFMDALAALGGEDWFRLGDHDLATHVERTRRLRRGERLSRVAADFAGRLGVPSHVRIAPMSDDPVRTVVETGEGDLPFQEYFVRRACDPAVRGLRFEGAAAARPAAVFESSLAVPGLEAVVVCPSNPYLSVDPILAVPGVRRALVRCAAPVVAVSPIVGGRAIKGPAAKIMGELGVEATAAAVAARYRDFLDGFVIDEADGALAAGIEAADGPRVAVEKTVMRTGEDRARLAAAVLEFARRLRRIPDPDCAQSSAVP